MVVVVVQETARVNGSNSSVAPLRSFIKLSFLTLANKSNPAISQE